MEKCIQLHPLKQNDCVYPWFTLSHDLPCHLSASYKYIFHFFPASCDSIVGKGVTYVMYKLFQSIFVQSFFFKNFLFCNAFLILKNISKKLNLHRRIKDQTAEYGSYQRDLLSAL